MSAMSPGGVLWIFLYYMHLGFGVRLTCSKNNIVYYVTQLDTFFMNFNLQLQNQEYSPKLKFFRLLFCICLVYLSNFAAPLNLLVPSWMEI